MNADKIILCLEDDENICELIKTIFEKEGCQTDFSATVAEGVRKAQTMKYSCIILDYHLQDDDGITALKKIRSYDYLTPIIFFTSEARESVRLLAIANGANEYLLKPHDFSKLTKVVAKCINQGNIV
jgi:DNA-binding response OmpR family regulator